MHKSEFSYLKWTAVVAVLAIALIPSLRPSTAKSQPLSVATAASGADLANEERAIGKYFDDLVNYDKQTAEVGKRASFLSADLDPLQRKSDELKGRLSEVQNTIREIIRKLKAANEWDNLDSLVVTAERERAIFKDTSFKKLLEESSNDLTSHANEISTPLDNLRKRLTSRYGNGADVQFVRAGYREAYEVPAPVAFYSVRCSLGLVRIKLIHKLGGRPTDATRHDVFEACHAPGASNPF